MHAFVGVDHDEGLPRNSKDAKRQTDNQDSPIHASRSPVNYNMKRIRSAASLLKLDYRFESRL